MKRSLLILFITATINAPAHGSADTQTYLGGPGPFTYINVCSQDGAPANVGAVCFDHRDGDYVTLSVSDASGIPVAARPIFVDLAGRWIDRYYVMCETQITLPVPPEGWMELQLYLAGPAEAAVWCLGHGETAGIATSGTATATFTNG